MAVDPPAIAIHASVSGASVTRIDVRSAFTGPSFCSRMNHAVVRTRIDVQNGTSTSAMPALAQRCGSEASVYATGYPISTQRTVTQKLITNVRAKSARNTASSFGACTTAPAESSDRSSERRRKSGVVGSALRRRSRQVSGSPQRASSATSASL